MYTRPVWAEISKTRLVEHYRILCDIAGSSADVLAIVKANAYGHDALQCAPILAAAGAKWLGVTCLEEALSVRKVCPQARILVMSGVWHGEAEAMIEHRLTPVVWEPLHLDLLHAAAEKIGSPAQSVAVHLEIDTGMSRQGVRSEQLSLLLDRFATASALRLEGVMTHFHSPEILDSDGTQRQIERFVTCLDIISARGLQPAWIHAGNSATLLVDRDRKTLASIAGTRGARLMLRPGLALYGYVPRFSGTHDAATELQPVLAWKTRIISLRTIQPGEVAGYSATFQAVDPTRLALLPVGYADGLNRQLSNHGSVLIRGQHAPIVGRVSMDLTIVDVTDIPGATIGDEAVLIGEQDGSRITAYDLSDLAQTIPYEVLCAIGVRVPRVITG